MAIREMSGTGMHRKHLNSWKEADAVFLELL